MTAIRTLSRRNSTTGRAFAFALGSIMLLPVVALQDAKAAEPITTTSADKTSDDRIRPFKIDVPQSQLDDMRKRIAETRWPDKETVGDISQGIQLARVQELVRYWGTDYDWRKAEKELNDLPEFI